MLLHRKMDKRFGEMQDTLTFPSVIHIKMQWKHL